MSVSELKAYLDKRRVSYSDCVEKSHLLERAKEAQQGKMDEDEEDPLDAFMADVKKEAAKPSAPKVKRDDIENPEDDPVEMYYKSAI